MARALPRALSPVRHVGYRWLAASLTLSLLGQGLWVVALVWQVVALRGGPRELSVVVAAGSIGMLATALLGGVLADRLPQRRILLGVQLLQAAGVGALAALSLSGALQVWHLVAVSGLGGVAAGLYYPAYSALLPTIVPAEDLLAANGVEGVLRPVLVQAAGPAAAGALVAAASPGAALAVSAAAALASAAALLPLADAPGPALEPGRHPVRALAADVAEGFAYMVRTPWLLATLVFASLMILLMMGPFEVLSPFVIKDRAAGGPAEHALVLAAFGVGGAVGSLVVASLPLPRRYLTVMNLLWGLGCAPLVVFGVATRVWPMVAAAFACGALFSGGMVIWGTLLQRRVPPHLLGRVSSLDFFVSLLFMPVSMALAGPVAAAVGLSTTFLIAGTAPAVIAVVAILAARMPADELAHPLAAAPAPAGDDGGAAGAASKPAGDVGDGAPARA
ncbi:MFS transporter [Quadrisphaera sp. DSM 44207]|uniref:MFS transporter n=1 Tax=Quadrisphaera sp. DSM 44207 TaxID=1881057 RepID=UPI0008803006|nr:MFS transporter [Quadrisphaera sp. DSM 44207]SDQ06248.1 Predicted arabinose efflux permease, MFS family [Quadrisphaera sp. DSM 44207]